MASWQARIRIAPSVCGGAPCIAGTRIRVSVILDNLAEGVTPEVVAEEYPPLTVEDVRAAIACAAGPATDQREESHVRDRGQV